MQLLFVLCFVMAASSNPLQEGMSECATFKSLSAEDYDFIRNASKSRIARAIPGFQHLYVDANGNKNNVKGQPGTQIEIAGSPRTSQKAMRTAADIVARMTKLMPRNIFTELALKGSVGIFTAAEKLIIFPEYANLASGSCGKSCNGSCSRTCTFDGRKYEDLAGVGGSRAVVLEDNVLCTAKDPYNKGLNVLSHELPHTIHFYALPATTKQQITTAYNTARAKKTWNLNSYVMANDAEYFAVGSTVFFYVTLGNDTTGGMAYCGPSRCASESAARERLRVGDAGLYNVLNYVFTTNRPNIGGGLTICPVPTI